MANQLMWCQQDGTVAIDKAPVECWKCNNPMTTIGWMETDDRSEGDAEEEEASKP